MRFSQRHGLTPASKEIQLNSIDRDLRNGLWNIFKIYILDPQDKIREKLNNHSRFHALCRVLWHNFYKLRVDSIPSDAEDKIRHRFFASQWYEVYDLLEFAITLKDYAPALKINVSNYLADCNEILEREFSGYRFINDKIAPISNTHEVNEIQEALNNTEPFSALTGVNIHLKAALSKVSDRTNPDYRNSIKESISAVESLAKTISNGNKDTLGAALDKIKGKIKLHASLEKAFKNLYGYTSDSSGIRHALTDSPDCDFDDAKYMLVSCSAFVNYVIAKAKKAGIDFDAK